MVWQDLVKVALLGTENSKLSDRTMQVLQAHGIDVQQEPATVLAQAAALLAQMKKAGFRLETFEGEMPEPVETSGENYLSPNSARHLEMMLGGRYEAVLPEFTALLIENKKTLPPESLPDLLERSNAEPLLEKFLPAIGAGGRWLLLQNPAWQHLVADPGKFDWHTGSKTERLALLQFLRKTDPARSLELLQATWETETPADKTDFLHVFWMGLSLKDEPFLEACLDDRRKEVREQAARLLAKIPGSRLSERMWRRAAACFNFNGEVLKINVEGDVSAMRDGILLKHPNWQGGAKAVFLGQVVSLVSPERWEGFFQKTPAQILAFFSQSEWQHTLLQAAREAILVFKNQDWLEPLLALWLENESVGNFNSTQKQLVEMATAAMVNNLSISFLQIKPGLPEASSPVLHLLHFNSNPWNDELVFLLISRFQHWLNTSHQHAWQSNYLQDLLKICALRCSPNLFESLQKGWNPHAPNWASWEKAVVQMLNMVQFRQEMRAELER